MHKAMSLISDYNSIDTVLTKLEIQHVINTEEKAIVAQKIKLLFTTIPQLKEWFSGDYEVLNERKILARGDVSIPDRVMTKDSKTIIIDYKREQKDTKHHNQIKNYGKLLLDMGYKNIEMYLIYTDDQTLVEEK